MSEVVVGLISAGAGFISGLLVPWVKWQIEKQKEKLHYRREHIKNWRAALSSQQYDIGDTRSNFLGSAEYSSLRVHLNAEPLQKVEAIRTVYANGGGGFYRNQVLLEEVAQLEKAWKLV